MSRLDFLRQRQPAISVHLLLALERQKEKVQIPLQVSRQRHFDFIQIVGDDYWKSDKWRRLRGLRDSKITKNGHQSKASELENETHLTWQFVLFSCSIDSI